MMDPACAASEEGAESGEQPERAAVEARDGDWSERLNDKPRMAEGEKWKGEKERDRPDNAVKNTLHIVLHLPAPAPAAAAPQHVHSNDGKFPLVKTRELQDQGMDSWLQPRTLTPLSPGATT